MVLRIAAYLHGRQQGAHGVIRCTLSHSSSWPCSWGMVWECLRYPQMVKCGIGLHCYCRNFTQCLTMNFGDPMMVNFTCRAEPTSSSCYIFSWSVLKGSKGLLFMLLTTRQWFLHVSSEMVVISDLSCSSKQWLVFPSCNLHLKLLHSWS
jgi:hypothetical protein